ILETHGHADHLSAAPYLAEKLGGKVAIGSNISVVQKTFGKIFNAGTEFEMDGSQFDRLFADGDTFAVGNLNIAVMHTPGHTPACVTYVTGDAAFIGDTLFMPDFGTARADFPGGSASDLYTSIQRILGLPDETRLFLCHDYKTKTRDTFCWQTTVAEQKVSNVHVGGGKSQDEFVDFRTKRDAQLDMPKLIIPSIQVNMNAGKMPAPDAHGDVYLKVPINKL
ncbi:MAG: MBL fold metallo-hydrolase, partial [Rhodobacter sp. BACL10 MAG-120419-bin15]